jgi:hypothetical protein
MAIADWIQIGLVAVPLACAAIWYLASLRAAVSRIADEFQQWRQDEKQFRNHVFGLLREHGEDIAALKARE